MSESREELGYSNPDPEKPRRSNRRRVPLPIQDGPCRFCPGWIVWERTESGAKMPLSWATREAVLEDGKVVAYSMEPHFADCPNWPKRSKRK